MISGNDYYEARQHLNLSQQAYDTVQSDKYDFLSRPSFAGMLNLIFSSFCTDADAAIDGALARCRAELEERLSCVKGSAEKEAIIEGLMNARRDELVRSANGYERGCQLKFQLSRENFEFMRNWRDERGYYKGSAGRFIKAVIEEYAAKPYSLREEIALRDRFALLRSCIESGAFMHVTTRGAGGPARYEVKPYILCRDSANSYNYLVGLSRPLMSGEAERPAAFRVSRLEKISLSSARSGKISAAQKKLIDARLKDSGVQFLLFEAERIKVRLSAKGQRLYDRQLHLRPARVKTEILENGGAVCEFQCTAMQAMFYFFKFGADAEILSPAELRNDFYKSYKSAAKLYESEDLKKV